MHFVVESVPGEITLMFVSYLLFCSILMYLFVRTDNEWGRLEVNLNSDRQVQPGTMMFVPVSSTGYGEVDAVAVMKKDFAGTAEMRKSLNKCSAHHEVNCSCFLQRGSEEV
ncbi:hypothetical protein PQR62_24635 [Herbaspirillum lusitanum]|uniref:Uncharacterized protein n=1 Tax=Herbaspirillum lusitanum TaxID=213312 RepID=A0ABW9AGW5_9BURK